MEASVDPQPRGPDWMPITPKTGFLFHAETHIPDSAEKTVRDIRRNTRRHHSAEEKIRIVLEGLRGYARFGGQLRPATVPLPPEYNCAFLCAFDLLAKDLTERSPLP
jgi:hypothetical protein